ncbi:hypothetical protein AZI86_05925 [Bdellovibrio bacteriovorus]|uniref:Uncharacterized protein n=1 Tax=Bdellovibrio bacteriovorus TaxID=959 RepID=A0A150WQ21_BDEBC|nr:hypothetical protein [Bdellovibrio bacteriovorus]KYG66582.1 hypothetical protein AZI86_05925 [Bdellovibrio bacteriovorus]
MKTSLFFLIHLIALSASAQVFNSSISSATGGTGRAAVEAGDAVFLNPSTLVHLRGSFLYSSFAKDEFAVTLTDNSPASVLPASLGFLQKKSEVPQGELEEQDIVFALSDFVKDKWSVGVTGHYYTQTIPGNSYRQINGDIGMMYTPKAHIGLGLVAYNVFGENKDIPENFRKKFSVGAGFNYIYEAKIRFRADITSESIFMGGLESYLNDFFILRVGYSSDTDDQRDLGTLGLAFKGPKFAINYAYQGNPQNSGDYRHSVDLEIPF